ncbi:hypothetical protein AGLY_018018 [Aphis glycines]|uniref:Uncharacterized protein n=1 Tax=Aphis glycines TaxID=307491 RepID=A0A6G0STV8_APHGL|nr:hypothetical protein AGLY_018018 [Aphis glycines]
MLKLSKAYKNCYFRKQENILDYTIHVKTKMVEICRNEFNFTSKNSFNTYVSLQCFIFSLGHFLSESVRRLSYVIILTVIKQTSSTGNSLRASYRGPCDNSQISYHGFLMEVLYPMTIFSRCCIMIAKRGRRSDTIYHRLLFEMLTDALQMEELFKEPNNFLKIIYFLSPCSKSTDNLNIKNIKQSVLINWLTTPDDWMHKLEISLVFVVFFVYDLTALNKDSHCLMTVASLFCQSF